MISVLLDTSALLYWTLQPDLLSKKARTLLEQSERVGLGVSSISVWEIGLKVKQERLGLGIPFSNYVERLREVEGLSILDVSTEIWVRNLQLEWKHRDPADRTIVATADLLQIPLITSDKEVRKFYKRAIW